MRAGARPAPDPWLCVAGAALQGAERAEAAASKRVQGLRRARPSLRRAARSAQRCTRAGNTPSAQRRNRTWMPGPQALEHGLHPSRSVLRNRSKPPIPLGIMPPKNRNTTKAMICAGAPRELLAQKRRKQRRARREDSRQSCILLSGPQGIRGAAVRHAMRAPHSSRARHPRRGRSRAALRASGARWGKLARFLERLQTRTASATPWPT